MWHEGLGNLMLMVATGMARVHDTINGMRAHQGFRDNREALAEEGDTQTPLITGTGRKGLLQNL